MAAWATLYQIFCLLPGFRTRPFAFVNRSVAIVHALVAVAMVTPLFFLDSGLRIGGANTQMQLVVLCITSGYFSFDIISWLWNGYARNKMDWPQIFHHSAVLTSLACTFRLGHSATDCALGLLVAELANPFMYMRYLLWCMGMADTPIGKLNNNVFMIFLTITVPIMGPILAYFIVTNPNSHAFHQFSVTGLVLINLYWFVLFSQKFMGGEKKQQKLATKPVKKEL